IIALTESMLVLWISAEPRRCRFDLVVFLVRMWRLNACERLIEPLPRTRKRFFAPDLVFIFGIAVLSYLLLSAVFSGAFAGDALAGLSAPSSGLVVGCFIATGFTSTVFFGASSITICRPSSLGNDSTIA